VGLVELLGLLRLLRLVDLLGLFGFSLGQFLAGHGIYSAVDGTTVGYHRGVTKVIIRVSWVGYSGFPSDYSSLEWYHSGVSRVIRVSKFIKVIRTMKVIRFIRIIMINRVIRFVRVIGLLG
jgi:hypothetical protein